MLVVAGREMRADSSMLYIRGGRERATNTARNREYESMACDVAWSATQAGGAISHQSDAGRLDSAVETDRGAGEFGRHDTTRTNA